MSLLDTYRDLLFNSLQVIDIDIDDDVTTPEEEEEEEDDAKVVGASWSTISASVVTGSGATKESSFRLLPLTVVLAVQFRKDMSVTSSTGEGSSSQSARSAPSFDSIIVELSILFIMNGVMER